MSWLLPGFLAAAAFVGLPLLLHFLRHKPKTTVLFPSLRFLGETAIRDTRRHRIQRWLTLLLRCLVIGALATAFARPFWKDSAAAQRTALVVAIDNSMSMQTRGRWETWRAAALKQLEALGPGDQAAVLQMFPRPSWIVPMTDDLERVRAAVENARPGYEKTRYAPALQVASDALAATPAEERILVWMADEQRAGWLGANLSKPLPDGIKLRLGEAAPEPKRQAALALLTRRDGGHLTATVRLYSPRATSGNSRLATGSAFCGSRPWICAPAKIASTSRCRRQPTPNFCARRSIPTIFGGRRDVDARRRHGGRQRGVSGRMDGARLPRARPARNAETRDWRAGAAAASHRRVASEGTGDSPRAGELSRTSHGRTRPSAGTRRLGVDFHRRFAGAACLAREAWHQGRPARGDGRSVASARLGRRARLWPRLPGRACCRCSTWSSRKASICPAAALAPLANWPDGTIALAEWSEGGQHVLLAGFPLTREATNWPTQPSFVPFAHQATRWLGSFSETRRDWRVGDSISLPEGQGTWRALDGPALGESRPAAAACARRSPASLNLPPQRDARFSR